MSESHYASRKKFLKQLAGSAFLLATNSLSASSADKGEKIVLPYKKKISANDTIRIGVIGMGIMGFNDLETALKVPGVELVGVCDLYTGRLERAKELYTKNLFTTRDYREILNRNDIDAVIVATSDQWHARIAREALEKGKAVYCEKPMVHRISEGLPLVAAEKKAKRVFQVGSQRVSSLVHQKARELYLNGEIGKLNMVNAVYDRQSALGAWQYTMPPDASPETVDWERYIAGMKKQPYDPKKFFWWRNYRAFGTGVAGDLFVHLLSGTHVITGAKGPSTIFSSGQLSYWKDERDVPDVMSGIMQYPETPEHPAFQLTLQVNFVSGTGGMESVRFIGEEGVMEITGNSLKISHSIMPKAPGIGGWDALETYPEAMQQQIKTAYDKRWTEEEKKSTKKPDIEFRAPRGYSAHLDHFTNFFDAIRTGKPVVEDASFGFRAAAPCLACNESYFEKKIIHWDPVAMKIKEPLKSKT
jgi:predicted dehydrogenase